MKTKPIDLYILSGFLGSGKSTLLKRLIEQEQARGNKIGVLMNELGEVSVDSSIVPKDTPLKEMLNGCICCTIQGELSAQLQSFIEEYELDVIFIEATGAAHPLEVVEACTHPVFAGQVRVRGVLTVVNARQWIEGKMSIKIKKLMEAQVTFADLIVVNKVDQVTDAQVEQLTTSIKDLNPKAIIIPTTFSNLEPVHSERLHHAAAPSSRGSESKAHVHEHLHLRTMAVPIQHPVDRMELLSFLKGIQGQIYRVKGFIHLKESPGLFLFNYAYGDPMFERHRTDQAYAPVLVFIGDDLDHQAIEEGLQQLQQ
ncbi:GTP-binding protein [Halalkalibacterium halodurans]|uniref:CobW family GTP-binding protein n=1 Tax=Halalkalibacterium halodurans TaxID=86665 RepID=UPI001585E0ED|nr:GTP-binding protein [Halalkalibacterium halodurans]MDY7220860.1 GTP-binding protein [Halalkalibacterium halodurans]MDY7240099.1 GTP-binding protein [Halalkalibacterium halodurans]MED4082580.1 GTP-binding protein [Halalkalibacterium halodurans]MED4085825.1 GTP-binding protein [Halalkalibacterium halodurans]MED4105691.1 GTP-binding protein [Halalkalibacterium halodurans]